MVHAAAEPLTRKTGETNCRLTCFSTSPKQHGRGKGQKRRISREPGAPSPHRSGDRLGAGGGLFKKKVAPETRACAVLAIAKIKGPEAKAVIQKVAQDKEVVVRNAVARALREGGA